jgi:HTTM domain/Vitamin K-dependent gamma-carboxylase, lumenal domain
MATAMKRWRCFLLEPVDAASVAFFRIVLGAMVAWDVVRYLSFGWVTEYYVRPTVHFTYLYLDFVRPWPGQWMYVHFVGLGIVASMMAAGLLYRISSILLFLAYTYVFLLEESVYMNHFYLIVLLTFLFVIIPAERAFSIDRWRNPDLPTMVPRWSVLILRFQLVVVYAFGAVAKLNSDWLAGEPMYSEILRHGTDVPPIAFHFPPALLAYAIAYGGIVVDLSIPALLCFRRTRWLGFAVATVFHVSNEIFLRIGIFSYLMTGAITIFFEPDWPRRVLRRLGVSERRPLVPLAVADARHSLIVAALHVYVLVQLLMPLRHWLYPGRVSWTEEGHRFSWHMKLRKKSSRLTIHVEDPSTGRRWTIDPAHDLRPRQRLKLRTFPDILLQYVHYQRDRLEASGVPNPIITVDWQCSLNGAPYRPLVDPTVNLAVVERSWRPATWIIRDGNRNGEKE